MPLHGTAHRSDGYCVNKSKSNESASDKEMEELLNCYIYRIELFLSHPQYTSQHRRHLIFHHNLCPSLLFSFLFISVIYTLLSFSRATIRTHININSTLYTNKNFAHPLSLCAVVGIISIWVYVLEYAAYFIF